MERSRNKEEGDDEEDEEKQTYHLPLCHNSRHRPRHLLTRNPLRQFIRVDTTTTTTTHQPIPTLPKRPPHLLQRGLQAFNPRFRIRTVFLLLLLLNLNHDLILLLHSNLPLLSSPPILLLNQRHKIRIHPPPSLPINHPLLDVIPKLAHHRTDDIPILIDDGAGSDAEAQTLMRLDPVLPQKKVA